MDISRAKACLGIDLSSYQTKETAVVRLTCADGEANFEIVRSHPFNNFDPRQDTIATQIEREIEFLNHAYQRNCEHIVIDAPIDISQLPIGILNDDYSIVGVNARTKKFHLTERFEEPWRLRLRPIDRLFNGQAPIFSFLGPVTQRARLALAKAHASESYPKISRKLVSYTTTGSGSYLQDFGQFLTGHNVKVDFQTDVITKDEFDAIWCALSGLPIAEVGTTHQSARENPIYSQLAEEWGDMPWPENYRLLIKWPALSKVTITRERI